MERNEGHDLEDYLRDVAVFLFAAALGLGFCCALHLRSPHAGATLSPPPPPAKTFTR